VHSVYFRLRVSISAHAHSKQTATTVLKQRVRNIGSILIADRKFDQHDSVRMTFTGACRRTCHDRRAYNVLAVNNKVALYAAIVLCVLY